MKIFFLIFFFGTSNVYAQNYVLHKSGDNKDNYNKNYQTNSLSLDYRNKNKKKFDLVNNFQTQHLGLPLAPTVKDNPVNKIKVALGKKLFFDRRLSLNNTMSCAMCHIPEQGFAHNELATAVGIEGRTVRRNAPTIYNVAYSKNLFHDAREDALEWQVWGPLLAKNEMGNPSFSSVVNKIKMLDDYPSLFEKAFDNQRVSVVNIGKALASYQRTLISANSNFDKWFYANKEDALKEKEKLGFRLFVGKARCASCHIIEADYALFTDSELHNTGIGYLSSMSPKKEYIPVQVAPGVFLKVDTNVISKVSNKVDNDLGLYEITENPDHRWKYKTPSLRNVALSSPYMHNGSIPSLRKVVEFYNKGGVKNPLLNPLIKPLNLKIYEIEALVDFLKALTGSNVNALIEDAFSATTSHKITH